MTEYVELHLHTNFSFLDGAAHPEDLVKQAAELGYRRLAITDHGGLYGIVRFDQAAREHGLRAIFGAEITLTDNSHLTLLIKNSEGYAHLSQMLTVALLENEKGHARVRPETLSEYHDGLIALSGCQQGHIPQALLNGNITAAEKTARHYRDLFGPENFYLELQHHNLPAHDLLCERLAAMGDRLGIGLVATNNVHYASPDGRRLQDILTCIKNHTNLDNANGLLYPNAERHLKPPRDIIQRFIKWPQAITNTAIIAERCTFSIDQLNTSLPDFPLPLGRTVASYLRKLVYEGAADRYGEPSPREVKQLEHELAIIEKLDLCGYFLIVWDIARFCRANGILCQGRGSAANSAVCYCLRITAVDPIKLELLFERFVSEQRKEPPDIDLDIANNRREEVIQYVYNKYGRSHAAMVCEVISYRGRSAVRDVGKALGFSLDEVDKLAKLLSSFSRGEDLDDSVLDAGFNRRDHRVELLIDLVRQIHRFPRHLGIHVGGMLITKRPLSTVVPVENATMPNRSVVQWDKDDTEAARFVKIDLLGLGMLSLLDKALRLIEERHGVTIDPAKLSFDDPAVYDLICRAETVGVFQVESRAQMNTLPRHKPRRFYDLVVEVALIRPGPIQGGMVHPYLRRRNGEEPVTYAHPLLEPILKRTLGVPLFQEQGMRVAVEAAGLSPSEADELRRAMGHKRSHEKMEKLGTKLIEGMQRNGIPHEAALEIFDQLAAFADFGFAESHAASFALLVYVSAYLKVYYPEEFYCSLLNSQPMGFYNPSTIVYEAQRRGIKFEDVDITKCAWDTVVLGDKHIQLGYQQIKGFGDEAREKIEAALSERPFGSIADFVYRTRLSKRLLEQLAMLDAFRAFGVDRRQALWSVLALVNRRDDELAVTTEDRGRDLLQQMNFMETLVADFKGLDLSTRPHLMTLMREQLERDNIAAAGDLKDLPVTRPVRTAGVVIIRQRPMTAKGFMFITLEDETGFSNIVIKPNIFARYKKIIIRSRALLVTGLLEKRDAVVNLIAHHVEPLTLNGERIKLKSRDFR